MPRYRVLEKSFFFDRMVEEGDEVDFDGHPGPNLEPLDDAGRAAVKHYQEVVNPQRIADLVAANPDMSMPNMEGLAAMIAAAITTAMAEQKAANASGDAAVARFTDTKPHVAADSASAPEQHEAFA